MKFKITRRELKENYRCVAVGYCDLQYLLHYCSPIAYNSGVYGWNYDVYTFEQYSTNIAICEGYRGYPGIPIDYNIYIKYEAKAKEIIYGDSPCQLQKANLNHLIRDFLDEIEEKYFKK